MGAVAMTATSAQSPLEDLDELENPDWATAFVIAGLVRVFGKGHAAMHRLESGAIEIRLPAGEVFHLDDETITRVA